MRSNGYKAEITEAWERVRAVPSRTLETTWGTLEYAVAGTGQPVLMSHGVMGGHPQGLAMVTTYFGDGLANRALSFRLLRVGAPRGCDAGSPG